MKILKEFVKNVLTIVLNVLLLKDVLSVFILLIWLYLLVIVKKGIILLLLECVLPVTINVMPVKKRLIIVLSVTIKLDLPLNVNVSQDISLINGDQFVGNVPIDVELVLTEPLVIVVKT